ncbi:MAG: ABC transporter ATP-binding protein, partial [Candidatus Eremiobacterota bacterium]
MIEVIEVTKKYKTITALNNISFKVEKGEIFGFLGPNGAGKTTTLRILTGQIKPTSGKASVCGYDIIRDRKHLKENIGVVFEHQNLYHRLSAIHNLELFRRLYGVSQKRVYEVLDMVELSQ